MNTVVEFRGFFNAHASYSAPSGRLLMEISLHEGDLVTPEGPEEAEGVLDNPVCLL